MALRGIGIASPLLNPNDVAFMRQSASSAEESKELPERERAVQPVLSEIFRRKAFGFLRIPVKKNDAICTGQGEAESDCTSRAA